MTTFAIFTKEHVQYRLHSTGKERDAESGNDYFGARYYASTMGRFLSPDPLLNSGRPDNPQSWNRYSYASNNPLVLTDPTGMYTVGSCNADDDTCKKMASNLRDAYWNVVNARFKAIEAGDMDAAVALGKSLDNLGAPGEKNSSGETVTINIDQGIAGGGQTTGSGTPNVTINLSPSAFHDYENGADVLAHEGIHVGQNTSSTFLMVQDGIGPISDRGISTWNGSPTGPSHFLTNIRRFISMRTTTQSTLIGGALLGSGTVPGAMPT